VGGGGKRVGDRHVSFARFKTRERPEEWNYGPSGQCIWGSMKTPDTIGGAKCKTRSKIARIRSRSKSIRIPIRKLPASVCEKWRSLPYLVS